MFYFVYKYFIRRAVSHTNRNFDDYYWLENFGRHVNVLFLRIQAERRQPYTSVVVLIALFPCFPIILPRRFSFSIHNTRASGPFLRRSVIGETAPESPHRSHRTGTIYLEARGFDDLDLGRPYRRRHRPAGGRTPPRPLPRIFRLRGGLSKSTGIG